MSCVAADNPASPDPTTITGWGCASDDDSGYGEVVIVVKNLEILFCKG